uniref:Uncharacterized protein n=1 Tax=Aegilops tauschii subsp. strangulata TaxID=200361 RepID=A0A453N222_AEGTS
QLCNLLLELKPFAIKPFAHQPYMASLVGRKYNVNLIQINK